MSREDRVHLQKIQDNHLCRLRTFWFRRISLISPVQRNDPCNDSHYILHDTLILAVRLYQAYSFPTLSREFPTQALPLALVTVGLPQMDRVAS